MTAPLPATMTAVEIAEPGGPDVLRTCTRPLPEPGHGQVLIRVAFAGVNRPDALQRAGSYAPPPGASDLPGLEVAGHVAALGPGVTGWAVGRCGLCPDTRGRLCRICRDPRRPLPAGARGDGPERGRLPARDLLYRLVQRLHARRPFGGRDASLSTADRPASARRRSSWPITSARGFSPPRGLTRNAPLARHWGPTARSTTATRISSRCYGRTAGPT